MRGKHMERFMAIRDFVERWRDQITDNLGNCIFECLVNYNSNRGTTTFRSKARIQRSGYDDGKVSLEESAEVVSERYHLDFSANFQDMEFDNTTNSLIIKGHSPKMGAYLVQIIPVV
jgi:hypothetical protein